MLDRLAALTDAPGRTWSQVSREGHPAPPM